jgi:hypothetical protein
MRIKPTSEWEYSDWAVACAVLCAVAALGLLGVAAHYDDGTVAMCAGIAGLGALVALFVPQSGVSIALVALLTAATALSNGSAVTRSAAGQPHVAHVQHSQLVR